MRLTERTNTEREISNKLITITVAVGPTMCIISNQKQWHGQSIELRRAHRSQADKTKPLMIKPPYDETLSLCNSAFHPSGEGKSSTGLPVWLWLKTRSSVSGGR